MKKKQLISTLREVRWLLYEIEKETSRSAYTFLLDLERIKNDITKNLRDYDNKLDSKNVKNDGLSKEEIEMANKLTEEFDLLKKSTNQSLLHIF